MSSYRVQAGDVDNKREEFRCYLEKNGVLQYIMDGLSRLYNAPERPDDPYKFFMETLQSQRSLTSLGAAWEGQAELEETKREAALWKRKYEELKNQMDNAALMAGCVDQSTAQRSPSGGDGDHSTAEENMSSLSSEIETPLTSSSHA